MQWSADARQLIVRIDRAKLVHCLERYLGQSLTKSPDLDIKVEWSSSRLAPLRHALGTLVSIARLTPGAPGADLIAQGAEQAFVYSLLMLHGSDFSKAIETGRRSGACSRVVRRAEDFIESNLAEPITIADLVDASAGSARTLFDSFKRFRDMSPMRYVRHLRLGRVHELLKQGDETTSVSGVALSWGFQHLGRFAAEYARQFGESPSATLQKAQFSRRQ
jgi:AraC-like DNA-binding protein